MEIYAPPGQQPIWPASINSVQLQQDYPNTDFTPLMTTEEKAEFNLFQVQPTEPPAVDPAENRLSGPVPALVDGQWVETWELVPLSDEEKAAYQQQINPPNWELFERLAVRDAEFDNLFALAQQPGYAPTAATMLIAALSDVKNNGQSYINTFLTAWIRVCRKVNPPASAIQRFAQAAQACRLPTYFVEAILAPIPTEE